MDASLGGPVLKISADNYNALKTKINLHHYGFNIKHHSDLSKAETLAKKETKM